MTRIVPSHPFRELDMIRREVDRVFGDFFGNGRRGAYLPNGSLRAFPRVNIKETETGVEVEVLAPGVGPSALEISVLRNKITIAGERPALPEGIAPEGWHRNERVSGRFSRTLTLPTDVDADKVSASSRNGIVTISLPKAESARPRRIAITAS